MSIYNVDFWNFFSSFWDGELKCFYYVLIWSTHSLPWAEIVKQCSSSPNESGLCSGVMFRKYDLALIKKDFYVINDNNFTYTNYRKSKNVASYIWIYFSLYLYSSGLGFSKFASKAVKVPSITWQSGIKNIR